MERQPFYRPTERRVSGPLPISKVIKTKIRSILNKNPEFPDAFTGQDFKMLNQYIINTIAAGLSRGLGKDLIEDDVLPVIDFLILIKKIDLSVVDFAGVNLLRRASVEKFPRIMSALIKNKNFEDKDTYGMTPLLYAAYNDNSDILKLLIKAGAKVNESNNNKQTALMMATFNENPEIVRMLLDANANVNARNNKGETALSIAYKAYKSAHPSFTHRLDIIIKYLKAHGATDSYLDWIKRKLGY